MAIDKEIAEAYFMYPYATPKQLAEATGKPEKEIVEALELAELPIRTATKMKIKVRGFHNSTVVSQPPADLISGEIDYPDAMGVRKFAEKYKVSEAEAVRTFVTWGLENEDDNDS